MKTGFRLKQFLLACGMLAFVTVFVTVVMRVDFERCKSASWPEIPCRVVDSSVARKAIDDYRFAASFKYEANGRTNSSSSMGSVEFRFPAVLKAKAVTSEIRATLMRTGKKKTVDIFAIP